VTAYLWRIEVSNIYGSSTNGGVTVVLMLQYVDLHLYCCVLI